MQCCWQNVTAIIVIFTFPVLLRRIPRLLVGATLTRVRPLCFDWHEFNTVGREDTQKPPVPNDHNFRHSKPTQPMSTCQASPKNIAFTFRYICTFFSFENLHPNNSRVTAFDKKRLFQKLEYWAHVSLLTFQLVCRRGPHLKCPTSPLMHNCSRLTHKIFIKHNTMCFKRVNRS